MNTACPGFDSASGTGISSIDKVGAGAVIGIEEIAVERDNEREEDEDDDKVAAEAALV